MRTFSLQSGSCGNCYFYESGDVRLLFDAGIPFRRVQERLACYGVIPTGFQGLFISHDHSDHTVCAGVFHRKLKVPIFCTRDTHTVMQPRLGKICGTQFEYFTPGDCVSISHVRVYTIPTPHDAANPCAFIVDDGCYRVGILTDLGHCFPGLIRCLADLDVAFLESNYDDEMLEQNPWYPYPLKARIRSDRGHLENGESARMVRDHASDRLQILMLAHLSQDNNKPEVALHTARVTLNKRTNLRIGVAPRDGVSPHVDRHDLGRQQSLF